MTASLFRYPFHLQDARSSASLYGINEIMQKRVLTSRLTICFYPAYCCVPCWGYHVLSKDYQVLRGHYFDKWNRKAVKTWLVRCLEKLGFEVKLELVSPRTNLTDEKRFSHELTALKRLA